MLQGWTSGRAPSSSPCPRTAMPSPCAPLRPSPPLCTPWWTGWSQATLTRSPWNRPGSMGTDLRAAGTAGAHALARQRAAGQDRAGTQDGLERCPVAPKAPHAGLMTGLFSPRGGEVDLAHAPAAARGVERAPGAAHPPPATGPHPDEQPAARGAHGSHGRHRPRPPAHDRAGRARAPDARAVTPARVQVLRRRPGPSPHRHLARRAAVHSPASPGALRVRHAPPGRGRCPQCAAVRGDEAAR